MRSFLLFCSFIIISTTSFSQLLRADDAVEVDILLGDTARYTWKKASVVSYDSVSRSYKVKIHDGDKMDIPSTEPEKWIRPLVNKDLVIKYGPGARLPYVKRSSEIQAIDCRPSEKYIRKNLRSIMAAEHPGFEYIYTDITKVKPQHGYDDPGNKGQFVYPYKIEMLIHLKRTVQMGGRYYTEYQTWEYDREYAYATRPKRKCEFYPLQHAAPKMIARAWY